LKDHQTQYEWKPQISRRWENFWQHNTNKETWSSSRRWRIRLPYNRDVDRKDSQPVVVIENVNNSHYRCSDITVVKHQISTLDAQQNITITAGPHKAQQSLSKTYQRQTRRVSRLPRENKGSKGFEIWQYQLVTKSSRRGDSW